MGQLSLGTQQQGVPVKWEIKLQEQRHRAELQIGVVLDAEPTLGEELSE